MKTCFQIAECSFSSAKIMQMSAMKTCFQIAECSFSSAKIMENERKTSSLLDFFAEMQLIFCKDSPFIATLHPYQI